MPTQQANNGFATGPRRPGWQQRASHLGATGKPFTRPAAPDSMVVIGATEWPTAQSLRRSQQLSLPAVLPSFRGFSMYAFRNRSRHRDHSISARRAAVCSAALGVLLTVTALTAAAHGAPPAARPGAAVAGNISWDSAPADPAQPAAPAPTPTDTPTADPGNISWDAVPADAA
jgi:hypothetical protein